jgi:hypothetical protein
METKLNGEVVLPYEIRDVKRVRISIIGERIAAESWTNTRAYVPVIILSFFRELEYQFTSTPPLIAKSRLDTMSRAGSIDFYHEQAERFRVYWKQRTPVRFICGIISFQADTVSMISRKTSLDIALDLEFTEISRDPSYMGEFTSKSIVLKGPGTTNVEVWVSITREIFIQRSHLLLSIHGRIKESESDRKGNSGLIPLLLGRESRI